METNRARVYVHVQQVSIHSNTKHNERFYMTLKIAQTNKRRGSERARSHSL